MYKYNNNIMFNIINLDIIFEKDIYFVLAPSAIIFYSVF